MELDEVIGFKKDIVKFEEDPSLPDSDLLIGIEVELENIAPVFSDNDTSLTYWNVVNDGSLRNNGKEFVLTQPLYGTGISIALSELGNYLSSKKPIVTERCSVHIHINVSNMSVDDLYKLISLYVLLEKPLMKYHGKSREDNIFCVPFYKAPYTLLSIPTFCNKSRSSRNVKRDLQRFEKYYALNIGAVAIHGSLEFRQMAGTTDMAKIYEWIQIIESLKVFALSPEYENTQAILDKLSCNSGSLLNMVFGEALAESLTYPGVGGDIINGGRIMQEVLHKKSLEEGNIRKDISKEVSDKIKKSMDSIVTDKITIPTGNGAVNQILNDVPNDIWSRLAREAVTPLPVPRNRPTIDFEPIIDEDSTEEL